MTKYCTPLSLSTALIFSFALGPVRAADATKSAAAPVAPNVVTNWQAPDIEKLPNDAYGELARYGLALTNDTSVYLGPNAKNKKMRYAGNNLSCQSCHENGATKPYAMPWVGVSAKYPTYRARDNAIGTIEDRVNDCMERSMAGKAIPVNSREMKAFVTYMHFLSTGIPVGSHVEGAGTMKFTPPDRKADLAAGKAIFERECASCHKPDGSGTPKGQLGDGTGYIFPALWGKDSFDKGAGMGRLLTASAFIKANMPLGRTMETALLSDDEAYDVAAYVLSHSRPVKPNLEKDYPLGYNKPVDSAYPPYYGGGTPEQHKYGPFKPLQEAVANLKPAK
jgi:thiosulfate dehydrogenase